MIRAYCDRCKKQCKDESFIDGVYGKVQKRDVGRYFPTIVKVTEDKNESHDYDKVDLCDKCEKELEEIISNFMNSK